MTNVGVIGAGAWGTALAITANRAGNKVQLWARETETVSDINKTHINAYLPGIEIPDMVRATSSIEEILQFSEVVLLVAPAQFTRSVLEQIKPYWKSTVPLVLCAKGLELSSGLLLSEVAHEVLPDVRLAVLSGPCFASEVAKGKPTAVTVASDDGLLAEQLVQILGTPMFRPYFSTDIIAPEVCGALKNVVAIAAGIADGCSFGDNGRAALITRGLNEMARFTRAMGGHRSSVMGMSGVGDLLLTATSTQSRNYSFGRQVGETRAAAPVLASYKATVEGIPTSAAVMKRARELNVDMPICGAVENVLYHDVKVEEILADLLNRPFKAETDAF